MKARHHFKRASALLSLVLLSGIAVAQDLNVPSEIFRPAQQKSAAAPVTSALRLPLNLRQKRTQQGGTASSFTLEAPEDAELAGLQNQQTHRKALQVGIRRDLTALPALENWDWQTVSNGQAAHFILVSEQASRLRVLLQTQNLPTGVELRIFDPTDETTAFGPYTRQNFNRTTASDNALLWTPTIAGQQLGIEVFLPDDLDPAAIQLTIPQLSHIAFDIDTQQFKSEFKSGTTKAFSSCDISIACAPAEWRETAKAVARYIYTGSDGNTYLCSGTLMADMDTGTQIPYFLTATHCIDNSSSAASMDFFWLDRESSCGANDASSIQVSGGATLLHSQSSLDSTLVQINNPPPAGTLMSGWSLESIQAQEAMRGIHHGLGNPKQFAAGTFSNYVRLSGTTGGYTVYNDPLGDFFQMTWDQGITAPGSSGSGVWATVNGQRLLKGNLVGGSSSCTAPDEADEYARLDRFHPYISDWLGTLSTPLQGLLSNSGKLQALTDGVLLGRYLDGIRGTALLTGVTDQTVDITALEDRIAAATANIDIDQDGLSTSAEDALLITRYLMGLRNDSLIAGINLNNSSNNTAQSISGAIEAFLLGQ